MAFFVDAAVLCCACVIVLLSRRLLTDIFGFFPYSQPKAKVLTDEDIAHKKKLQAEQKALKAAAANMKGAGGKKKKK